MLRLEDLPHSLQGIADVVWKFSSGRYTAEKVDVH